MFEKIITKYKSGFPGKDRMRENAEAIFGKEFKDTPMEPTMSLNTPSNEKVRQFKKGGEVRKKMIPGGSLTDMHDSRRPVKMKIANNHTKVKSDNGCYKEGGSVSRKDLTSPKAGIYEREMMESCRKESSQRSSKSSVDNDLEHPKSGLYERDMRGGKIQKSAKVINFAAGGVAKIRHGQSNKNGMPIKPRSMKKK